VIPAAVIRSWLTRWWNVELQIVMGLNTLLDANNQTPAELNGYGPLPAELARDLLATSKGKLWWRRLYAAPAGGPLVGGDPYRRHFDSHLERLIRWRDRGAATRSVMRRSATSTTSSATARVA